MEQQTWSKDVIITGLETKHRSYARAAAGVNKGEDAPPEELQTLEQQVLLYLSTKHISLDDSDISSCYAIPNKNRKEKPSIVVQFVSQKHKIALLRQTRKLKGIKDLVLLWMDVKKLGNLTIDDMSDRDELKRYDFDNEIDPDMYYYSNLDINCNYYTEQ